jgi:hypothetical protein
MNQDFNPLKSKQLFAYPKRLLKESAWNEHVPFAMFLVELQQPRVVVELGTQFGVSYCAFCQAVTETGFRASCYAVDTWTGDGHAGLYGHHVYEDLKAHHKQYESFSQLLRMTFDGALQLVPDKSVDLLHIDGLHTYEAVKRDYNNWLSKMSDRGIILFHDTVVTGRGFGVHISTLNMAVVLVSSPSAKISRRSLQISCKWLMRMLLRCVNCFLLWDGGFKRKWCLLR